MASLLQATLLTKYGNPAVAEAFVASRIAGDHGSVYGTLPRGLDIDTILERALP